MRKFRFIGIGFLSAALTLLALIHVPPPVSYSSEAVSENTPNGDIAAPVAQSRSNNLTYYTVRSDLRRCVSPLCGGFWVKRVNNARTRCANGRNMEECYVAEIDWSGQRPAESQRLLVRGELRSRRFPRFGQMGVLRVTESWTAASERAPEGMFFRVKDLGIRCITHPCLTHQEERLNSYSLRKIAGVELDGANASSDVIAQAHQAMTSSEGVLVAGRHGVARGPAGRAETLRATQFYLRSSAPVATKPCIKTGCGNQVCAEEEMITTCEWRPEHECYRRARCERQTNGQCGFTQTRELTACLRRS